MQDALRKAGVTEDFIAGNFKTGMSKLGPGRAQLGYLQTGAELLDSYPAKKHQIEDVTPQTYADLEHRKAKSPEEARKMADSDKE